MTALFQTEFWLRQFISPFSITPPCDEDEDDDDEEEEEAPLRLKHALLYFTFTVPLCELACHATFPFLL
jgi:hypothetical protein